MRRILNHGPDPASPGVPIDGRAVSGCWFELHRQGGCGPGEIRLERGFAEAPDLDPGDCVSIGSRHAGVDRRFYLGRVESWEAAHPAGVRVRLGGLVGELGETFVGGFGRGGDRPPHRYAATDPFPEDPDRPLQSHDFADRPEEVVDLLAAQYVQPQTRVLAAAPAVAATDARVDTMLFRGEESVRGVLRDLAVRAGHVDWGVDERAELFFRPGPDAQAAELRVGREVTKLTATRARDAAFDRLQITGDYVYDRPASSGAAARPAHRRRYTFLQQGGTPFGHGGRRVAVYVPWVRTADDAEGFADAFFARYGAATTNHLVEAVLPPGADVPRPWAGRVRLCDEDGETIAEAAPEAVRVRFDEAPVVRLELGPEDPRRLWPEPPLNDRYEVAPAAPDRSSDDTSGTVVPGSSDGPGPSTPFPPGTTSSASSGSSSGSSASSGPSSNVSSGPSSDPSSFVSSDGSSVASSGDSTGSGTSSASATSSDTPGSTSVGGSTSGSSSDAAGSSSALDGSTSASDETSAGSSTADGSSSGLT